MTQRPDPASALRGAFGSIGVIAALGALAFSACGSDQEDASADGPTIVATTAIAADLARNVAPGATVEQLVPDGASPHEFELSAEDRLLLEEADLVVAIGAGLEAGIPLEEASAPVWALAANAPDPLPFAGEPEDATGTDHAPGASGDAETGEDHGGTGEGDAEAGAGEIDPHIWMDPARVAAALPSLAEALAAADPGGVAAYERAAGRYAHRLRRLDRELRRTLAAVPPANRELVTSHDSLAYLADRYGFEVLATAFPASGPEAEPSAARLAELIETVESAGVPAVFAAREDDPEALRTVADAAGVAIETDLVVESPAAAGGYPEMLRHDAAVIAAALR